MPNRWRAAAAALALAVAAGAAAQAPAPAPQGPAAARKRATKPVPLFASDTALRITLVGDWRALAGDRDTLRPKLRPGVLSFVDSGGRVVRIPVQLSTRGHFRLMRETCTFPPLRVAFDSGGTKKTPFAGQRALKLGTHCNASNVYEQYVLREHLAYEAHNLVSPDLSFRSRLARVRYVDARDTTKVTERWGRFLEAERDLGARLGGKVLTARGGLYADIPDSAAALLGVWEYFIGNTDFSMASLHNVRLVATEGGTLAVPYDFDFSGLVDTRYSAPDSRLPIRNVRQRLYRGPCLTEGQIAPILARFVEKRDAIRALYTSLPALDAGYAKDALSYIDDFYAQARDPAKFARSIRSDCVKGA